jgi:hypothetical protein
MTPVSDAAPRMLELINRDRAVAGLGGLSLDDEAGGIAVSWSREMAGAGDISHNDDYLSEESLRRLDASKVGENVAHAGAVDEIHSMLMDSPPHRANILDPDFRLVGVGAVRSDDGSLYLTEDFLTRRGPPAPRPNSRRPAPSARRSDPVPDSAAAPSPKPPARKHPARKPPAPKDPARKPSARKPSSPVAAPRTPAAGPAAAVAPPAAPTEAPSPPASPPALVTPASEAGPEASAAPPDAPGPTGATPGTAGAEAGPAASPPPVQRGPVPSGDLIKGVPILALMHLRRRLRRR